MINDKLKKDLEGSIHGLIKALPWHLTLGIEHNHEKPQLGEPVP
jgi:hypothetical protein